MSKYTIECAAFKEQDTAGAFRSYDLHSEGDSLEELLANATYAAIDQDGGECGYDSADDDRAQAYIAKWFANKFADDNCNCEGGENSEDQPLVCSLHSYAWSL